MSEIESKRGWRDMFFIMSILHGIMSNLVEQLKEQRKLEMDHVKKIKPSIAKTGNRLVATLLEIILLDSMKHASICKALIDVNGGEVPSSMDLDMGSAVDLHQDIKQHVRVEEDMLNRIGILAESAKDKRVSTLIQYILEDEKRHHSTLQALSNLLDQDTTAFYEYLELFQKYMVVPSNIT